MALPDDPTPGQAEATQKQKAGAKRRGPKGYFKGSRKEFLESHVGAYTASKKGSRQTFWHKLYRAWWQRYPWKLEDDEEPPTDNPDEMAKLAEVSPGEEGQKKQVEQQLTERLTTWFINRASAKRRDPPTWVPLLQRLHQIRNPRPRCRTVIQQFMREYAAEVNAAFVSRHADGGKLSNSQKMNLRHDVAKTLLANRYHHLTKQLEKNAAAQHEADMEEWGLMLEDISAAEDVSRARDSLFDAVHPLLQAIGRYAGCYVSLIAGNAEKDDDNGFFTAVHWWPGDRASTKDWTQWDGDAFNTGVAGPFLTYAGETDQLLKGKAKSLPPGTQTPMVTPRTLPDSALTIDDMPPTEDPPTHPGSTSSITPRASYRPLPAKKLAPVPVQDTKKRKYVSKSRPIRYFEDTGSEEDDPEVFSGDGSSSGDSLSDSAPSQPKRQRTSKVTTRSSARTSTLDADTQDSPDVAFPAPALTVQLPSVIPSINTGVSVDNSLTNTTTAAAAATTSIATAAVAITTTAAATITTSVTTPDTDARTTVVSVLTDAEVDAVVDAEVGAVADAEVDTVTDAEVDAVTDAEVDAVTDAELDTATDPKATAAATSKLALKTTSPRHSVITPTITSHSPPLQASAISIDVDNVPAFLRSHGKGKREVDIFNYLNNVEDPHFRQVLLHYIRIEAGHKSVVDGSLPTAKRPVEISQWSSRARPANIPDFTKGKRTFSDFVDSVFTWWGSIQPDWRSFERGSISRDVRGEWDVLYAPRVNGLLNVVMLVYWWVRILEEQKPKGSVRADYERFAGDVAWVFSNLSD